MTPERPTHKHNLPAPTSSFIGREQELRQIQQSLGKYRLITLTGTGGTGKTRLALEAAATLLEHFSDGVWLIDLAPLAASELVLETIAKVLTLPEAADPSPIAQLGAYLEAKHLLLMLDNCEHVIEESARIVASLLGRCPHLALLATSREPLAINGEVVLHVPALSLPDEAEPMDRVHLLHYDALRLFVERVQAADPSFRLTDDNAGVVVEICRHLDGLPLALELAAVRVRGMGVTELLKRLDQRFQLLTGGDRAALPRQQTLHAMIDWSYRLLPEPEQIVLRRLAIFVGAFTLQAAESVCAGAYLGQNGRETITPETVLTHLLQLVNKSLVQFHQQSGHYRLLETIRIFSLERLRDSGETQSLTRQHFAWYLQLAEQGAPGLSASKPEVWAAQVEQEHDNFRAALGWAIDTGRSEEAARCTLALWRFWHTHTYQREGLRWLERILMLDGDIPLPMTLRPQLLNALGVLSHTLWQFDRAASYHAEALRMFRECGDGVGMAQALFDMGWQQFEEMKLEQARIYARESLALAQEAGDQALIANALLLDGLAATEADQIEEAIPVLEESLAIWQGLRDTSNMAKAMGILARAEGKRGNHQRANPLLRDAVRLHVQVGNYINLIGPMVALCVVGMHTPLQPEGARFTAQVLGIMTTWEETIGGGTSNPWQAGPKQTFIDQVTMVLGVEAFAQAFEIGRQMTLADLVRLAEQITALPPAVILPSLAHPTPAHASLTARELEVLQLLAQGLTSAQMAKQLVVSIVTINFHVRSIYNKLGLSSRSAATRYAIEHHLV